MPLFQCNNHPISFHIFGIGDAEHASLTELILGHGGEITKDENSLIKFTSSNFDTNLYNWAKIYNTEFITDCAKQKRFVEPEEYRLGIKYPNDEYHMLHFLYGTCCISPINQAESQLSSQTTDNFLTAQNSSISNSINNLDVCASRSNSIPKNPMPLSVMQSPEVSPEGSPVNESTVSKRYASLAGGDIGENHQAHNDEKRLCNLEYEHELKPKMVKLAAISRRNANAMSKISKSRKNRRSHEMKSVQMSSINDISQQQNDVSGSETDIENVVPTLIRTNVEKPVSNDEPPPSRSNLTDDDLHDRTTDVDSVPSSDSLNSDTPIIHMQLKNPICTKNTNGGSKVPNIHYKGLKRFVPDSIRSTEKLENRESDTFARASTSKDANETSKKSTKRPNQFQSWNHSKKYAAFYDDSSSSSSEDSSPKKKRSCRVNNSNTSTSKDTVSLSSNAETVSDKSANVKAKRKKSRNPNASSPRALPKIPVDKDSNNEEDSDNIDVEHVYKFQRRQKNINEQKKGAKWRAKLTPNNCETPTRHPFSSAERKTMIMFLVNKNYIKRCKGFTVWRDLIQDGLLTHRTPQSLRNQFMKTILPSIEQAKFLDSSAMAQFLKIRNNIGK